MPTGSEEMEPGWDVREKHTHPCTQSDPGAAMASPLHMRTHTVTHREAWDYTVNTHAHMRARMQAC